MPTLSIFRPLLFASIVISSVSLVLLTIVLYRIEIAPIEQTEVDEALSSAFLDVQIRMQNKLDSAMAMALMLSTRTDVIQSLKEGDRDIVANGIKNIRQELARVSQYKNVGVQVVYYDKTSFVKSWNLDSFGEEIHHDLINKVFETKQFQGALTMGARGLGWTGVSPVMSGNDMVGAITAVQGMASVVKDFKQVNKEWLLVLDDQYLMQEMKQIPTSVQKNKPIGDRFRIAHNEWFDANFMSLVSQHTSVLVSDVPHAELVGHQMMMVFPVHDERGRVMGRHVVLQDAEGLFDKIAEKKTFLWLLIVGIALLLVSIVAVLLLQMRFKIMRPLSVLVRSVQSVIATGKFDARLPIEQLDEIGVLTQSVNQLFCSLEHAVDEANQVMCAIARADFAQRMTGDYVGDLALLKRGVNASADQVSFMMDELAKIMQQLSAGHFNAKMHPNVPKQFRDQVEGALMGIHDVLSDIGRVMHQMNQGNFSDRVTVDAQGDLLTIKHNVNQSMDKMAVTMSGISSIVLAQSQGDLTRECVGDFFGELRDLKDAVNASIVQLRDVVAHAVMSADVVSSASSQVSQGAHDLSARVQEQASALEQTSATMNEMNAAVQSNTANAHRVAVLAHQVEKQASDGVAVMQKTIDAMKAIHASSAQIGDIVALIDGIAFQTNLLALNAAVEAARAGEHGRGFAVVAGEVRALAQKSADAAKDIKTLIEESVTRIQAGTQLADQSGEMLSGISHAVEDVANMIEAIAQASQEQSMGIGQVHKAISDIDRVTQENSSLVEQTTSAAHSLNDQANQLRHNMSFFKTGR